MERVGMRLQHNRRGRWCGEFGFHGGQRASDLVRRQALRGHHIVFADTVETQTCELDWEARVVRQVDQHEAYIAAVSSFGVRAMCVAAKVSGRLRQLARRTDCDARVQHAFSHEPLPEQKRIVVRIRRVGGRVQQPVIAADKCLPAVGLVALLGKHTQSVEVPKGGVKPVSQAVPT
eukprot:5399063-Pleurochrysis_carterae.AAC.2